jgi:hypothetical protein
MKRSPVEAKIVSKFAAQFAMIMAIACVGGEPAFALNSASLKRLNEMQIEASEELKALQKDAAKRIAVYKSAELKFDEHSSQIAEESPALEESTQAVASVEVVR